MAILTFPGGQEVQVEFDPSAHSYVVAHKLADGGFSDFRPTHGITAPLVTVPKPYLVPWGAKEGTLATLDYINNHPEPTERLYQFFIDLAAYEDKTRTPDNKPVMSYYRFNKTYPWYPKVKASYKEKSNIGKELGTWLHESIEIYYNSGRKTKPVVSPDCEGMWSSFLTFDNFWHPDVESTEFLVYSLMFGYSGQGDVRAVINGKYCIGDWKSTNRSEFNRDGIDVDYFYQVGGLAQAEYERTGKWVDDLFIANFDKKGDDPRVIFASEFGMSPQDAAKAYVSHFNTYHMHETWDYKYKKR